MPPTEPTDPIDFLARSAQAWRDEINQTIRESVSLMADHWMGREPNREYALRAALRSARNEAADAAEHWAATTVGQLIEELQQLDPMLPVRTLENEDYGQGGYWPSVSVSTGPHGRYVTIA